MKLTTDKNAEIANKLNFRQSLSKIEDVMHRHPSAITGDDFEDCVFVTVHATDKLTIEEVTKEVIAEDFSDPLVALK